MILGHVGAVKADDCNWGIVSAKRCPPSQHPAIHDIASLILVCKYFARICRPKLYRSIVLRNCRQFKALTDLAKGGAPVGPPVLTLVRNLHVITDENNALWIHQVATVIIPWMDRASVQHTPTVTLSLDRPLVGVLPTRTHLPRPLPPSIFQNVSSLELKHVHFQHAADLLRSILYFSGLKVVRLESCTCEPSTTYPALSRAARSRSWSAVYLEASAPTIPTVISAILYSYAARHFFTLLPHGWNDFRLLADMIVVVHDYLIPEGSTYCHYHILDRRCIAPPWL